MTPQQLVGVGVRLFAVWLAITSFSFFTSIPKGLRGASGDGAAFAAIGIGGAYLVVAVCLWFFPMVIAHTIVPRTRHENRLSLNAYELARVGSSLVGLWLLARSLQPIVWFVFRSFLFMEAGSSFSSLAPDAKLDIAVAAFEVLLAVFLIVKSSTFAAVIVPESKAERGAGDL
jgi:hypothetical protein